MSERTTNEKDLIIDNLNYLGLDLNNVPDFLMNYKDVDYKPSKVYEQADFKVYKYVNLKDIQILLTPTNRLNSVIEKYSKAIPICEYLDNKNESNIIKHAFLLKMIEKLSKVEINKIAEEQIELKSKIPFKVKYDTNYLWEIYYSEFSGRYFMLVTTEDQDYSAFFYLLKKQIECYKENKDEFIFVPISYLDYTRRYLKKSEISNLEKYIWLFTKEWPKIYEVFDKKDEMTIHIVGITSVYEKMKSFYKIKLEDKEQTVKFYTLVKALFILQTELPHHYVFETQINENGELIFEFNNKIINYDNISSFIKAEYKKNSKILQEIFDNKQRLDIKREKLKEIELEKNKEYLFREKQVATYLECRTSILGKIKYFFKSKNTKFIKQKNKENQIKQIKEKNEMEKSVANSIVEDKSAYTIEDLIKVCIELDRVNIRIKDAIMDISALEKEIEVIDNKIKNATLFIEKIEEHKKSIFEFWRFANKDVTLGISSGTEVEEKIEKNKIKRTFDYEEDIEDLGIEADKIQRNVLTKEETDSIYVATTEVIEQINKVRNNQKLLDKDFKALKEKMKRDFPASEINSFDIFGNIKNDKTQISVLANKKHRESQKSIYKILDLSDNLILEEYTEKIKEQKENIEIALKKMKALTDMNIYMASNEKLDLSEINKFYINPSDAINTENSENEKINLYKIKIKEGMNIIYNTNIIYYDNINNTLPIGMNVSNTVIFDMSKYKVDLKKQKIFRINRQEKLDFKDIIVCVYEYEVK